MASISLSEEKDLRSVAMENETTCCRSAVRLNGLFFLVLVALAAVPLILWRDSPILASKWFLPSFAIAVTLVCIVWWQRCKVASGWLRGWPKFSTNFFIALGILTLVTWIAFYLPQCQHFWGGYDEFQAFPKDFATLWSFEHDRQNGRPFVGWSYVVGRFVAGGAIEGYLWYAAFQCGMNGLLLWAILHLLLPNAQAIGLAAAILLVVHRADPLKFYPLWGANAYAMAVGFMLLAIWLYMVSWRRQNRGLLVLACAAFGASLLMVEVGYLLAVMPLLFLWIERRRTAFWKFWAFSWIATWCLFATRVAIFQLSNSNSYQLRQAKDAKVSPQSLIENFLEHLGQTAKYFDLSNAFREYWGVALLVGVSVAVAVWWIGFRDKRASAYTWPTVILLAALGISLGIAPYSHIASNQRTQFYAAPSQAALVAFSIGWLGHFFSHRVALAGLSIVAGLLSANAVVETFHQQHQYQHVTYDKTVHVCNQIRAISSTLTDDTLILLLHEGPAPLGANYGAHFGGKCWVGARIEQLGETKEAYEQLDFEQSSLTISYFNRPPKRYDYNQLLIFRMDADGTLAFQPEWPNDERLPQNVSGYDPLKFLGAGAIAERRDFDFPSWSGPPVDIVSQREGIVLGRGWSPMQFDAGWLYREAEETAELMVNGQGELNQALSLEIEPLAHDEGGHTLEVRNQYDTLVATVELVKRHPVHLTIPCTQNRLELIRLNVRPKDMSASSKPVAFRVYCPNGPLSKNPLHTIAQITSGGVRLGHGWYPCETHGDQQLRWLNTDGEIITGPCDHGESPMLTLEAMAGPGMDGNPCSFRLTNLEGQSLASAVVRERERVALTLPTDLPQGTRLKLEVLGGGKTIPSDPRILNLMVTKCDWQSNSVIR